MVSLRDLAVVAGAMLGAMTGWIISGGLLAAALGLFLGGYGFAVPFLIHEGVAGMLRRRKKWPYLEPIFGGYHTREKRDAWEGAKARLRSRLAAGDVIKGAVVHTDGLNVYLDIGCGFPARFSLASLSGEQKKETGDPRAAQEAVHPEPGDELKVRMLGFIDDDREIELAYGGCWVKFEDEIVGLLTHNDHVSERTYSVRPLPNKAYPAFMKSGRKKDGVPCEVLCGGETREVKATTSGRYWVSISFFKA